MVSHGAFIYKWKANKQDMEKNNDVVTYTLTGSSNIKQTVAPIKDYIDFVKYLFRDR
jgi:hypothetical protein